MGGYHWEQIVIMLLDRIESSRRRNRQENVRLNQVLKRRSEMIMIGDMLNNNKRRNVKTRLDQQMYLGKKYRQDKKTRLLRLYLWR